MKLTLSSIIMTSTLTLSLEASSYDTIHYYVCGYDSTNSSGCFLWVQGSDSLTTHTAGQSDFGSINKATEFENASYSNGQITFGGATTSASDAALKLANSTLDVSYYYIQQPLENKGDGGSSMFWLISSDGATLMEHEAGCMGTGDGTCTAATVVDESLKCMDTGNDIFYFGEECPSSCEGSENSATGECEEESNSSSSSSSSAASSTSSSASSDHPTITSSITGKTWMDRNLGASRACQSFDDEQCYGDYYQWGRTADGHEKSDSGTTSTQAISITPSHGNFITGSSDWTTTDSNGTSRQSSWNPCPSGFRIPTMEELEAENITNRQDAFDKLKIPAAGGRFNYGSLYSRGYYGSIWSSTPNGSTAQDLYLYSSYAVTHTTDRANGLSVRCLKE